MVLQIIVLLQIKYHVSILPNNIGKKLRISYSTPLYLDIGIFTFFFFVLR